mmetsp:Transcript_29858/g.45727  ORF Transcript_29858/g.45727 Transcript_29858/m.45727 type:complete len:130 (+) Transcript_29858:438-827(+)
MDTFRRRTMDSINSVIEKHSSSRIGFERADEVRSNKERTWVKLTGRLPHVLYNGGSHTANYLEDFPIPDYFRRRKYLRRRLAISDLKSKFTKKLFQCLDSKHFPRFILDSKGNCKGERKQEMWKLTYGF